MILSFELSMPNVGSWDGKWTGSGRCYVVTRTFRGKKQEEKATEILENGYYHYSWSDGWGAGVTVNQVDSGNAARLRNRSDGFCGYDWMVDSIIERGKILASHEVD